MKTAEWNRTMFWSSTKHTLTVYVRGCVYVLTRCIPVSSLSLTAGIDSSSPENLNMSSVLGSLSTVSGGTPPKERNTIDV